MYQNLNFFRENFPAQHEKIKAGFESRFTQRKGSYRLRGKGLNCPFRTIWEGLLKI